MYTHIQIYLCIYVYIIYLFLCVYRYVEGSFWNTFWNTFLSCFPFSFFFFLNLFCKIQSRCWEEKGDWKRMSPKSRRQQQCVLACFWLGVIKTWRTREVPGEKWPWGSSSHAGDRQWEWGCPWAPYSGKEACPFYPPKHGEEQFGIWQATKGTVPRLQT